MAFIKNIGQSSRTEARTKKGFFGVKALTTDGSNRIWNSRLSWKIMTSVFMTILAIHVTILALTIQKEQNANLDQLAEYSSSDGYIAVMNNGQKLVISRRRLDDFMQAIDQRSKRI